MSGPKPSLGWVIADRYLLGEVLGRGAAGEVRAAWDDSLQRPVAVKLLHSYADEAVASKDRFLVEARTAARLSSPHAVAVYDYGEVDGAPFLVMEQMSGRTWADELRDGLPRTDRVCDVAAAVLTALATAHAVGIVHRDVKPSNVMLTTEGVAKLGDFGLARSDGGATLTRTGDVVGSFAYVAPERAAGDAVAGPASDVWAAGVLLYESLAGVRPFLGDSPMAVVHGVLSGAHTPLGVLRADLPTPLTDAVESALLKDPDARPSAAELALAVSAPDVAAGAQAPLPPAAGSAADELPTGAMPAMAVDHLPTGAMPPLEPDALSTSAIPVVAAAAAAAAGAAAMRDFDAPEASRDESRTGTLPVGYTGEVDAGATGRRAAMATAARRERRRRRTLGGAAAVVMLAVAGLAASSLTGADAGKSPVTTNAPVTTKVPVTTKPAAVRSTTPTVAPEEAPTATAEPVVATTSRARPTSRVSSSSSTTTRATPRTRTSTKASPSPSPVPKSKGKGKGKNKK